MRRIGVVVNPIAGLGGRVGLKGTDGKADEALERGARPRATDRAREALTALRGAGEGVAILACGGVMGEDVVREAGFDPEVLTRPDGDIGDTRPDDTHAGVRAFVESGVDLILFVGGDGTAVDVAETLDECDADTPMLGVPAGVKVYSAVFAVTPRAAGEVAATFDRVEPAEVNDIDEDDYREGEVRTELRAVARVPVDDRRQASKQLGGGTVEGIAEGFAATVEDGRTYVLGPGSTLGSVKEALGFEGSPLGVDVWRDSEVLVRDAAESDILEVLGEKNTVVVSPIGGQGFVFGRGNQQISPAVIRQSDIEVVASRRKLDGTGVLRVDTGDAELDDELGGWIRVRVGRVEKRLVEVVP